MRVKEGRGGSASSSASTLFLDVCCRHFTHTHIPKRSPPSSLKRTAGEKRRLNGVEKGRKENRPQRHQRCRSLKQSRCAWPFPLSPPLPVLGFAHTCEAERVRSYTSIARNDKKKELYHRTAHHGMEVEVVHMKNKSDANTHKHTHTNTRKYTHTHAINEREEERGEKEMLTRRSCVFFLILEQSFSSLAPSWSSCLLVVFLSPPSLFCLSPSPFHISTRIQADVLAWRSSSWEEKGSKNRI